MNNLKEIISQNMVIYQEKSQNTIKKIIKTDVFIFFNFKI